jgi:plastocyanin
LTTALPRRFLYCALGLAAVVALTFAAACGGGGDDDDGGSGGVPTSAATQRPAQTPGAGGGGGDGEDGVLRVVALNTLWEPTELEAPPGSVTIELDNQDAGIVHNIRVYRGSDDTGEDMGATELESGPVVQTLKLDLTAGEYFYVCEAHPATMSGTLTVE